ncbi:MAG: LacI family DNA-binding transcriptional regulator [Enterococcus sp.]
MKKKITIKEIAQQAGVSVSTVSRVINNHPSVKEDKRKLIQEIIDQESFQPSMLARGMVSSKTRNLAIVVPDINNPYFTDLISQIEVASYSFGYSLLLFNTMVAGTKKNGQTENSEQTVFQTIIEKSIDGVLILGGEIDKDTPDTQYLDALNHLQKQIPVVVIGQKEASLDIPFIERNLEQGTTTAVSHLLALGHKKIGFLGGEPGVKITTQRLDAFKQSMNLYSEFNESFVYLSDFYTKDGYSSMDSLLAKKDQPTAILAINDNVAIGAIRSLVDHGLACPKDMKIVSCDAFAGSEYTVPRLTTVDQNNPMLAQCAVTTLLQQISEGASLPIPKEHIPKLIIRESCGILQKGEI